MFRIELRGAKPTNGHTGEPEIHDVTEVEAPDWIGSREAVARRYGIDAFDPAMFATRVEPAVLEEPAPKKRARKLAP
jgi:hypothetical protein